MTKTEQLLNLASQFESAFLDPEATSNVPKTPIVLDTEPTQNVNLPYLPETFIREGSTDCPSGMCPADH